MGTDATEESASTLAGVEEPIHLAAAEADETRPNAFAGVEPLLAGMQQTLVAYTGQADLKANIVITTSSLVLTVVATRWSEHSLRPALAAVAIGTLLSLLSAITVVIPKFRLPRKGEVRVDFEAHENPLFFGHFASMPRRRFIETIAEIASDDAALYEAQAADIYDQGRYLVESKYRHLRVSYIFLGLAFVAGAIAQTIATLA
jgi:hypothetical protein